MKISIRAKLRLCLAAALVCALAGGGAGLASSAQLTAKARPPQRITITPVVTRMEKGDTAQVFANVYPSGANSSIRWSSSNRKIATVDQNGLITAVKTGNVRIRAASKVKPSVYKKLYIKVVDTKTVTGVVIENDGGALLVGTSLTLTARVLPSTASQQVTWSSSRPEVADVSPAGVVTGYALGNAIITAEAGGKSATQRVEVLEASPVSSLPSRITTPAQIRENLAKIDKIKDCAIAEIHKLSVSGAEKESRRKIIEKAFRMASFPWMSKRPVKYWWGSSRYAANAVYYGIPYTQTNRAFNDTKILNSKFGFFRRLPGNEYYTATLKDRTYPGNDCSSFVSMSIWGLGKSYSYYRTRDIYKSSLYKTIATRSNTSGYQKLRPGDLFVRDGHVAMFLYFCDSFNRVMIIQQGGLNTLNTVACAIKPLSYYSGDKRYIARRVRKFE